MAKHAETTSRRKPLEIEYNTGRPLMIIPEYGRHVQKMAQHLITIKDRKERLKATEVVIQTMAQVHPYAKDGEDLRRKLWDHLYIISNYELDVDGPYPKPKKGVFESKPERLQYPTTAVKYMHYGKIIPEMIRKAVKMKDNEERDVLIEAIAMLMKKAFMMWNKSTVSDNIIIKDLADMSQGKLELKDVSKLNNVSVPVAPQPKQGFNKGKRNKNKNRKKRNRGGF